MLIFVGKNRSMTMLETFLEILKYTVPALVVYLLIRQFLQFQAYGEELKRKGSLTNETLGMRLKNAILISVQKEFEHNLTQQLYVSAQLWEMVELLKDETISLVTASFLNTEKKGLEPFVADLYEKSDLVELKFGSKVKDAIKKEVEIYFQ